MPDIENELTLSPEEKCILLRTAREAIRARLACEIPSFPAPTPRLQGRCGAFVTLYRQGALRGCIGYVQPFKPLVETVREVAQSAAFADPRFPAVCRDELARLRIEISVLSPLRRETDPACIRVGSHGLLLRQGYRSGLLLPQVAVEYGWDRETFLDQTCRKAGLPAGAWRQEATTIETFSAVVFGEAAS